MKHSPIIACTVLKLLPPPESGALDVSGTPEPGLVEIPDKRIWSENRNALIDLSTTTPLL
jgi:hypothetical protein